jgi:hypothetical protein
LRKENKNKSDDVNIGMISDSNKERKDDDNIKVAQYIHSTARSILEKSSKLFLESKIGTLNCFHSEYIIGNSLVLIDISGCSKTKTLYKVLYCKYLIQLSFFDEVKNGLIFHLFCGWKWRL